MYAQDEFGINQDEKGIEMTKRRNNRYAHFHSIKHNNRRNKQFSNKITKNKSIRQQPLPQIQSDSNEIQSSSLEATDIVVVSVAEPTEHHPQSPQHARPPATQQQQQIHQFPLIPIPETKFYSEIFIAVCCFFEMILYRCTYVHIIWILFYAAIGYRRHQTYGNYRGKRLLGELINMVVWIITNYFYFMDEDKDKKRMVTPLLILIFNMDYYFMGTGLVITTLCYFVYLGYMRIYNFRCRRVQEKLRIKRQKRLKELAGRKLITDQAQLQSLQSVIMENSCSICLEEFKKVNLSNQNSGNQSFRKVKDSYITQCNSSENRIVGLKCYHFYHFDCIVNWMEASNRCPICRKLIV